MKFRFGENRLNQTLSFSKVLPDLIDELDIKDSYIIQDLISKWSKYVGDILSMHSQPDRIFKKTLFVDVDHSVYLSELSLQQKSTMKKINADFGDGFIYNIKFNIKNLKWKKTK